MIQSYSMNHHGLSYNQGSSMDYKKLNQKDFIFIKNVESRWRDMDAIGHINNATYLTYFETARVDFLKQLGFDLLKRDVDSSVILASMKVDYIKQSTHPSKYSIGCRITRLGNKSFDLLSTIFVKEESSPIVIGVFTLVAFNYKTQKSIPLNKDIISNYLPFE